jgi:hypothetical protein
MKASALGTLAAEQMKAIEDDEGDGEVKIVCSVVGIEGPNGEQNVRMRANCPPAIQAQLLAAAQQVVAAMIAQGNQPGFG